MSDCIMCGEHICDGYGECPTCWPFYKEAVDEKRYEQYGLPGYMYNFDAWACFEKIEIQLDEGEITPLEHDKKIKALAEGIKVGYEEVQRRRAAQDAAKQKVINQLQRRRTT